MATDDDFDRQIKITLSFEGGYSSNPDDPGGETNFGISKRAYPDVDIKTLTMIEAISIYHRDYWLPLQPEKLSTLIACKLFDMSVNMGRRTAIILLQRAINHTSSEHSVTIDGMLGPRTFRAVNQLNGGPLLMRLRIEATNHYMLLIANNPSLDQFRRGWMRRAAA